MSQEDRASTSSRAARPAAADGLSAPVRAILIVLGTVSLVIGIAGVFLPLLPTTPFLLLAAACYARSSERLYGWLLGQPSLGPIVTEWRASRSLPPGVKTRAVAVVAVTFGISLILIDGLLARAFLLTVAIVLVAFLARIPTAGTDRAVGSMGRQPPGAGPR